MGQSSPEEGNSWCSPNIMFLATTVTVKSILIIHFASSLQKKYRGPYTGKSRMLFQTGGDSCRPSIRMHGYRTTRHPILHGECFAFPRRSSTMTRRVQSLGLIPHHR